jgi:hypothetical protein
MPSVVQSNATHINGKLKSSALTLKYPNYQKSTREHGSSIETQARASENTAK